MENKLNLVVQRYRRKLLSFLSKRKKMRNFGKKNFFEKQVVEKTILITQA